MKKKKLKLMNIKEDQELSRYDLKSIMAGSGGGHFSSCTATKKCGDGNTCECSSTNGTCETLMNGVKCTDSDGTSTCYCV